MAVTSKSDASEERTETSTGDVVVASDLGDVAVTVTLQWGQALVKSDIGDGTVTTGVVEVGMRTSAGDRTAISGVSQESSRDGSVRRR